jgi:Uma2 family endonuclease
MTTIADDPKTPREPARYGRVTPQAYLVRERAAEYRSEYFDGEIEAMAGAPEPHVIISGNIFGHLFSRLPPACRAMQTEMRVRSEAANTTMYPDVLVACGERRYIDQRQDVLRNPVVVFEVLSPSTERKDRTTKASAYKRIDSLQAYVLVSQKEPCVEVYARAEDGSWPCALYQGLDATVRLEAIGCSLSLAEIYRDVLDASADAASAQSGEDADADHD